MRSMLYCADDVEKRNDASFLKSFIPLMPNAYREIFLEIYTKKA